MATVQKTSPSINVPPGMPIFFTVTITVTVNGTTITGFGDGLPPLLSGNPWFISSQNPVGSFTITGPPGSQQLLFNHIGVALPPGPFTVTIQANTNVADAGQAYTNLVNMSVNGVSLPPVIFAATVAICIHGSSMVTLANDKEISISNLKSGEIIIGADGKETEIIEAVPCWAENANCGDCIIFEKDSLGPGIPSSRFAVDAGHPIATPEAFKKNGGQALIPAKWYLNNNKEIYVVKWDDVAVLLPGENRRFDIIMKEDSCKAYIANGIVVQARQSRIIPGYSYH